MIDIGDRLAGLHAEIQHLAAKNETQSALARLIAVSKKQPIESILQASNWGQKDFAENYVQEALPKIQALAGRDLCWHFIGPVQSNKCKDIALHFDWLHTLDRIKVAKRLSELRPASLPPLQVLVQVNIDNDQQKSGVAVNELDELVQSIKPLPGLQLRGLMTILHAGQTAEQNRNSFAAMRALLTQLQPLFAPDDGFVQLSMGMSADWRQALKEGATMLRLGTAIFGARSG